MVAVSSRVLEQILLMLLVSGEELAGLGYQCLYLISHEFCFWDLVVDDQVLHLAAYHLRSFSLRIIVEENSGGVLSSSIVTLSVQGSWIMEGEEISDKLLVSYFIRVESYLQYLHVPGVSPAHLLI